MPIGQKSVPMDLSAATPTPLTTDSLKVQLDNIGLTCDQAALDLLAGYIEDVKDQIPNPPDGATAWTILKPQTSTSPAADAVSSLPQFASLSGLTQSSVGNWTPNPLALGYSNTLEFIQYPSHFTWLKANRATFTGVGPTTNTYSGSDLTVEAIKLQFQMVATSASAALDNGLNRDALESVLSNAISPLTEQNAKDYNRTDSRVIFLVENYDSVAKTADGIGVLTVAWTLVISDYKTKKGPVPLRHNYALSVTAYSVLYDSVDVMNADYAAALAGVGTTAFASIPGTAFAIPPKSTSLTVFPNMPPGTQETFNHGLPVLATAAQASVLVLYSPDLQNIGSIDNSKSAGSASYSKSVQTGFTFSMTQTLTVTGSIEAEFLVVKAGVSVAVALSFTEQWSTTTTETISFTVPAGALVFLYQGFLLASLLTYDAKTNSYTFGEAARCLSPVLVTSATPLIGAATMGSPSTV
jgi:hypothetical protein